MKCHFTEFYTAQKIQPDFGRIFLLRWLRDPSLRYALLRMTSTVIFFSLRSKKLLTFGIVKIVLPLLSLFVTFNYLDFPILNVHLLGWELFKQGKVVGGHYYGCAFLFADAVE